MRLGKQKKKSMQNKTTTPFPYVSIYSSTSSSAFHFTNDGLRSLLILAWNRKRKKRIRRLKVLWSLLQGLPQNTQISTNILLILKENKLHKWDRCFLFVMTVTFLRPPSEKPPGCAIHKQGPYNMWPNTKDLASAYTKILVDEVHFLSEISPSFPGVSNPHTSRRTRRHF